MPESGSSTEKAQLKQVSLDKSRLQLPDILPGCRCRDCGEVYYPRRMRCSNCTSVNLDDIAITPKGKLASYTTLTLAPPGSAVEAPYSIGAVVTPEGAHITTVLTEPDPEKLKVGMDVEMVVVKVREDAEGNDVMAYKFKPV
jgi:uncharacterized OB-fold protein